MTAEAQLKKFIGKFAPANQKLIRAVRRAMRKRLPTANEIVYDNYNFFVIGYGPTDSTSDCIFSIAAAANGVNLFFLQGARLRDPGKILLGSGRVVRRIKVPSADVLARREVAELMDAAVAQSRAPFAAKGRGKLIIRSVSAKQRPRRR
jgi:hypothetical protein